MNDPEFEPNNQIFVDLVDSITYVVDDAFYVTSLHLESSRTPTGNNISTVELIQFDTKSSQDEVLFSVLLSENGGKAPKGVEKIRILASQNGKYESIVDASELLQKDSAQLPYKTNSFFIAHQSREGDWRYCRIDDSGIYPWMPYLQEHLLEDQLTVSLDDVDILEAISKAGHPSFKMHPDRLAHEEQVKQLDMAYAEELIEKLDSWTIIPQN